jgi:lysophospholipase L1-like esterase
MLAGACGSSGDTTHATGSGGTSNGGSAASGGSNPGTGGSAAASGSGSGSGSGGASNGGGGSGGAPVGPKSQVHIIARVDKSDPAGPRFAWPGSAIVTRFKGTDLRLTLDDNTNYFAVVIDGGAPSVFHASTGRADYVIAQGLPDAEHDVWIEKRTETFEGVTQYLGFTTNDGGSLVETPEPFARKIEVVGDSITCGYGNEGAGPNCEDFADEDEYLAYGAVAARALKAEHMGISYSGIGLYRDGQGDMSDTMPIKYDRIFADDDSKTWDFSWIPDVVVVNLGTNDFATGDPGQPYVDAYIAFAKQIRGHYPDALIVCAVGSMLGEPQHTAALDYAKSAVAARAKDGDTNLSTVDLGIQDTDADGTGCEYHPTTKTDQKMADKLVAKIRSLKGW